MQNIDLARSDAPSLFVFHQFKLLPARRMLVVHDRQLKLGSRAFDLLSALVERHERVVTKGDLLDLVWPGEEVGEANLAVQVMAIRKLLGQTSIANVSGRGYRFTLPVMAGRKEWETEGAT